MRRVYKSIHIPTMPMPSSQKELIQKPRADTGTTWLSWRNHGIPGSSVRAEPLYTYPILFLPPSTIGPSRKHARHKAEISFRCEIAGNSGGPVDCLGICISNSVFQGEGQQKPCLMVLESPIQLNNSRNPRITGIEGRQERRGEF